jgi:hypothetical protein
VYHRWGHRFDSTTSPGSGPYGIGVISTDGYAMGFTTDWYGGFGKQDNTGSNTCLSATDYWRPNWTYGANLTISIPNSTKNPKGYLYNTGSGGTTGPGPLPPAMNQTVSGTTVDNTVTWTNSGLYTCRQDVVIVQTQ